MEVTGRLTEMNMHECNKDEALCEPCKRGNTTVGADGACRDCEEYMCHTCFGHHLKAKTCSNHVLVETSQYIKKRNEPDVEICEKHDNEKVKFFCRKHDDVGCGDCMVMEHNTCKPEYIKQLSKDFGESETFKDIKLRLNCFETDANSTLEFVDIHKKENKTFLEKALEEITNFRASINNYFDKAEENVRAKANRLKFENDKRLENVNELIKSIQKDVTKLQQNLSEEVHCDTVLFIHSIQCKPTMDNVETSLESAKSENAITHFNFEVDEAINGLICAEQKLGRFDTVISRDGQECPDSKVPSSKAKKKWRKCDLTPSMFSPGVRVQRGPDWTAGNTEDCGSLGTVTAVYHDHSIIVKWDHSEIVHPYRAGSTGTFDVEPA